MRCRWDVVTDMDNDPVLEYRSLLSVVIDERDRARMLLASTEAQFNHALRRIAAVSKAAEALYLAAHWSPDRDVDAVKLWTELRDALGLLPGTSPKPVVAVKPTPLRFDPLTYEFKPLTADELIVERWRAGGCIMCEKPGRGAGYYAHWECCHNTKLQEWSRRLLLCQAASR